MNVQELVSIVSSRKIVEEGKKWRTVSGYVRYGRVFRFPGNVTKVDGTMISGESGNKGRDDETMG